jgi:hypothetical protein
VPRRAALALALLVGLAPALAHAAPIEFVEQRKNYMIFNDIDGTVENANWFTREPFYQGYYPIEDGFLQVHADDSQFIVVYSTFKLVEGVGAFYQSLANDVAGIGYEQAAELDAVIPAEFFDDTPNSQFQGMLHMNDWHNFLLPGNVGYNDEWISLVFGQELGHAWLSFVHADLGDGPSDVMLGRAKAHWSYYLHSDGSPVEGHRWTDHGDGNFTAAKLDAYQFSDLDLYLMGLMPPEEVKPWFVIEDPHDCIDSALPDMECAPVDGFSFKADQYRVQGTRRDITIDQVIAAEGPRVPAYPDAPNEFNLAFLLIKRPDETLCEGELAAIDEIIDRSINTWVGQTRGRANIVNKTHVDDPVDPGPVCVEEPETSSTSETSGETGDTDEPTPTSGPETNTTGGSESGSSGSDTAGELDDAGCGCRHTPTNAWLLTTLLPLIHRRRRAA